MVYKVPPQNWLRLFPTIPTFSDIVSDIFRPPPTIFDIFRHFYCVGKCHGGRKLSEIDGKCRKMSENVGNCRNLSEFVGICRNLSEYVGICREFVENCRNLSEFCRKMSEIKICSLSESCYLPIHPICLEPIRNWKRKEGRGRGGDISPQTCRTLCRSSRQEHTSRETHLCIIHACTETS